MARNSYEPPTSSELVRLIDTPAPLSPDDFATTVSARLRATGASALPVVDGVTVIGVVGQRELLGALVLRSDPGERVRQMLTPVAPVPLTTPLSDAMAMLQRADVEVLPVAEDGRYVGIITRERLLSESLDRRTPKRIGGMATPLGVYLTDGLHRGGRGDLALILTGAYLTLLMALARLLGGLCAAMVSPDPQATLWATLGGPASTPAAAWADWLPLPFFAMLLRLSPLAGYHAGEHQAVHLVEGGLALTSEQAALMPRVHPRCGTNLGVLLLLLTPVAMVVAGSWPLWALLPAGLGLWQWRRLGGWAQQFGTTRPPSDRHRQAGIAAAKLLLRDYEREPFRRARLWRRVWNRGLLQVALGATAAWWAGSGLTLWLGAWIIRG
ncbi:MAG: DUF1385 domain-containing protein [Armatimonadetes bacterium]|nr:DUF1385 domain-containing protein [Armatimonadota bacterium]